MTKAVFFDVDFTLIHPGPAFQGHGYAEACARHGVAVDAARFDAAVSAASATLHAEGGAYDPEVFIDYTRRIIEGMGGSGPGADAAARDLYDAWSACHHFTLYEEVPEVLREPARRRLHHRPHLEYPAIAEDVRGALRAARAVHGRDLLVGPRLHEAAPVDLRGRRCAAPVSPPATR